MGFFGEKEGKININKNIKFDVSKSVNIATLRKI